MRAFYDDPPLSAYDACAYSFSIDVSFLSYPYLDRFVCVRFVSHQPT